MNSRSLDLSAGARGIHIDIPESVNLLPVAPLDAAPAQSATQQQELLRAALLKPEGGPPLRELAQGKRHVAVLVGDLSQPAPYETLLAELIRALVEAEIRPTRIGFLVWPGHGAPVLGRGAIRRYGEQTVGDHELRAWIWEGGGPAPADPRFEAADLRIALRPRLAHLPALPQGKPVDLDIRLTLGKKLNLDIVAAHAFPGNSAAPSPVRADGLQIRGDSDVWLTGGGGEWDMTLEEALLSLHAPADARTAVLAFGGEDGLGSARFAGELWGLLREADEVLARDGALPAPAADSGQASENRTVFDPAGVFAAALGQYENVVLFSAAFMEHPEAEDLADRLVELPRLGAKIKLCATQASLWNELSTLHGASYRLHVEPLGWRRESLTH